MEGRRADSEEVENVFYVRGWNQEGKLNLEDPISDLDTVDSFIAEMRSAGLPTEEAEKNRRLFAGVLDGTIE